MDWKEIGGTSASGPRLTAPAIAATRVWNWVARTTVTGSPLRSSTSSQAYLAR